ncbi:MAG: rhodanese-like domain-containing protein [Nanoarchaeota archaeon]|nr:rhodanese-like domain-containing protein [Nanoarchaeota archaeon]
MERKLFQDKTPSEFTKEHLKGAININIYDDNFKKNLEKLDKKKTYLVHCHAGVRCFMAAEVMEEKGFTKIYSVNGNLFE